MKNFLQQMKSRKKLLRLRLKKQFYAIKMKSKCWNLLRFILKEMHHINKRSP